LFYLLVIYIIALMITFSLQRFPLIKH